FRAHSPVVVGVAFSPEGKTLATAGDDHAIRLWEANTGKELVTIREHDWPVMSVAFSPDGTSLASASLDGTVGLGDARSGAKRERLRLGSRMEMINSVVFTPDGRHLVTANGNSTLYVLRLAEQPR